MAGSNRGPLITKLYKVLKQHYKPIVSDLDRPLLEQMLFACCLENAAYDKAAKTYEHLATAFFDWNEVRVSTVNELAEAMRDLPDPAAAAGNLKRLLQTVFESTYSFELESLKKQNIGVGIKRLEKLDGATPFVVAFATQQSLGGHFIPLDRGALDVLYIVGIATEGERQSGSVAGLERTIPKNKGIEFGSLLHQLSADFVASPFSPQIKTLLQSVSPDAKDRMPKRGQRKEPEALPAKDPDASRPAKPDEKAKPEPAVKVAQSSKAGKMDQNGSAKPDKVSAKSAAAAKDGKKAPAGQSDKKKASDKRSVAKPSAKSVRSGAKAAPAAASKSTKQLSKRKPR